MREFARRRDFNDGHADLGRRRARHSEGCAVTGGDSSRRRPAAQGGWARERFLFDVNLLTNLDGDERAREAEWLRVFRHFDPRLRDYLSERIRDENELDELMLRLWRRALRGLPRLQHAGGALNYLRKIADNLVRDRRRDARRAARRQASLAREAAWAEEDRIAVAEGEDGDERPPTGITPAQLTAILEEFPPDYRDVLTLRLLGGLEHQEIAEQLGLPTAQAASQRFSRARRLLKERLRERGIVPSGGPTA